MRELIEITIAKSKQVGIPVVIFAVSAEDAANWVAAGVTYIAIGADSMFLFDTARALVQDLTPLRA